MRHQTSSGETVGPMTKVQGRNISPKKGAKPIANLSKDQRSSSFAPNHSEETKSKLSKNRLGSISSKKDAKSRQDRSKDHANLDFASPNSGKTNTKLSKDLNRYVNPKRAKEAKSQISKDQNKLVHSPAFHSEDATFTLSKDRMNDTSSKGGKSKITLSKNQSLDDFPPPNIRTRKRTIVPVSKDHGRRILSDMQENGATHVLSKDHKLDGPSPASSSQIEGSKSIVPKDHQFIEPSTDRMDETIIPISKDHASLVSPSDPLIQEIQERWRRRQSWHRAEKSLTLAIKAFCRRCVEGGDKGEADKLYKSMMNGKEHPNVERAVGATFPLQNGRSVIEKAREQEEKMLVNLAAKLPIAPWVQAIRGFGLLGLAGIVGEAGDLANYPDKGKLWKRLGLACMPDGKRQRRVSGAEAMEHGYSPARRSVVWTVGDSLFKHQSAKVDEETGEILRPASTYRVVYDERKPKEMLRKIFNEKKQTSEDITPAHAHNAAKRYMEKRLVKDLWMAWRGLKQV